MISVLTCPRPGGISYIEPLLDAINTEVPEGRLFIVRDGPILRSPPDNKFAGWRAIEEALRVSEDLLFLEDDVRPAFDGAIREAIAYKVPEEAGYSSFHLSRFTAPGIRPSVTFMMSQAVKIPLRSLNWLVKFPNYCIGDWQAVLGFDCALASAGHAAGWFYEQKERNYFNHVGLVSAAQIKVPLNRRP